MTKLIWLYLILLMTAHVNASEPEKESPVKHRNVAAVTTLEQAQKTFIKATFELQSKHQLDPSELHQIHVITYDLEQAVAYFQKNLGGDAHSLMQTMADTVESIHLHSENNRKAATRDALDVYHELAQTFLSQHWNLALRP